VRPRVWKEIGWPRPGVTKNERERAWGGEKLVLERVGSCVFSAAIRFGIFFMLAVENN
jgi:hypothetical protein